MNKRARARLIGVTAIILIAVVAIIIGAGAGDGAYSRSVVEVLDDPDLVGERVKVTGTVIDGSWDMGVKPMRFDIRDTEDEGGGVLAVVYDGNPPDTFGDGVTAIVTGVLGADGTLEATEMIAQCPSKYESAEGALAVSDVLASGEALVGAQITVSSTVVSDIQPAGGATRFAVADGGTGEKLGVAFDGGLPADLGEGSVIVMTGTIGDDGVFHADEVSLAEE